MYGCLQTINVLITAIITYCSALVCNFQAYEICLTLHKTVLNNYTTNGSSEWHKQIKAVICNQLVCVTMCYYVFNLDNGEFLGIVADTATIVTQLVCKSYKQCLNINQL